MSVLINPYAFQAVPTAAAAEPQSIVSLTNQTTTFNVLNVPIGPAAVGRRVFILLHYMTNNSKLLSSATIGGVAAVIHEQALRVFGSELGVAIISAPLDAGTTTTVSFSFQTGGTPHHVYLKPYKVTGLLSAVAGDTATFTGPAGGVTRAVSIDVVDDGILLAGAFMKSPATGTSISGVTEDYDSGIGGARFAGGSLAVSATEVGRSVSFTRTGGSGTSWDGTIVAAAFR